MPRQDADTHASKPSAASRMRESYFEMDETIQALEDSNETHEASRLRARQSKLADAYFFKFVHPQLKRIQAVPA